MRRSRTAKLLTAAIVAAGLLALPAPALAQRCTLGYDIGLNNDRSPSLCSFFKLPSGQAGLPLTSGPDGRVGFFVRGGGGESHGITRAGDGTMWVAAGSHLVRITPSGGVTRISLPGGLPADGGIATDAGGRVWFASGGGRFGGAGSSVGRYDAASSGLQRFRLDGRALDVVRGPGDANVWASTATDSGRLNWITRLSTRSFGLAKPRQWSCAGQTTAACWFHIPSVPLGDLRLFHTHARPGGLTVGPDR